MKPSSRYQFRIESIESSTDRMKHADTCCGEAVPTLNQTGELNEKYWCSSIQVSSCSKTSASSGVGEVAVVLAGLAVGLDHPVDQLPQALLPHRACPAHRGSTWWSRWWRRSRSRSRGTRPPSARRPPRRSSSWSAPRRGAPRSPRRTGGRRVVKTRSMVSPAVTCGRTAWPRSGRSRGGWFRSCLPFVVAGGDPSLGWRLGVIRELSEMCRRSSLVDRAGPAQAFPCSADHARGLVGRYGGPVRRALAVSAVPESAGAG